MEALILAIIIAYAVKKAAEDAHLHWQKSKAANRSSTKGKSIPKRAASAAHHDTGYWAHQVLNGFPQIRNGLADGWHAGRKAQAEGAQRRNKARTEHLEQRAGVAEQIREHRKRQDEALERIRRAREPEPEEPEDAGKDSEGAPEGTSPGTSPPAPDENDLPDQDQDHAQDPAPSPEERKPVPPANPEKGDNMPDITYEEVKARMERAQSEAEQRATEVESSEKGVEEHTQVAHEASEYAARTGEEMQALEVDPDTLSAMLEHFQAVDDCERQAAELQEQLGRCVKAWHLAAETAQNVLDTMKRSGHQQMQEARDNAANGGAKKEFYES